MNCQRCLSGEVAYRVHTDAIDMKVCAACGAEARRLGIAVEVLIGGEGKVNGGRVSLNFRITGQNSCLIAGSDGDKTSLP